MLLKSSCLNYYEKYETSQFSVYQNALCNAEGKGIGLKYEFCELLSNTLQASIIIWNEKQEEVGTYTPKNGNILPDINLLEISGEKVMYILYPTETASQIAPTLEMNLSVSSTPSVSNRNIGNVGSMEDMKRIIGIAQHALSVIGALAKKTINRAEYKFFLNKIEQSLKEMKEGEFNNNINNPDICILFNTIISDIQDLKQEGNKEAMNEIIDSLSKEKNKFPKQGMNSGIDPYKTTAGIIYIPETQREGYYDPNGMGRNAPQIPQIPQIPPAPHAPYVGPGPPAPHPPQFRAPNTNTNTNMNMNTNTHEVESVERERLTLSTVPLPTQLLGAPNLPPTVNNAGTELRGQIFMDSQSYNGAAITAQPLIYKYTPPAPKQFHIPLMGTMPVETNRTVSRQDDATTRGKRPDQVLPLSQLETPGSCDRCRRDSMQMRNFPTCRHLYCQACYK